MSKQNVKNVTYMDELFNETYHVFEKKGIIISRKTFSSTTIFNIDNNKKYFLSSKSAY